MKVNGSSAMPRDISSTLSHYKNVATKLFYAANTTTTSMGISSNLSSVTFEESDSLTTSSWMTGVVIATVVAVIVLVVIILLAVLLVLR